MAIDLLIMRTSSLPTASMLLITFHTLWLFLYGHTTNHVRRFLHSLNWQGWLINSMIAFNIWINSFFVSTIYQVACCAISVQILERLRVRIHLLVACYRTPAFKKTYVLNFFKKLFFFQIICTVLWELRTNTPSHCETFI